MSCTDFPSSGLIPNVTTHTVGNITYIWTGIAWESQVNVPAGELVNDLSQAYIFETVAEYQASTIVFPTGKTIITKGYYEESDKGESNYTLLTLTEARDAKGDPTWEPDGYGDHYSNDNTRVILIETSDRLRVEQLGIFPTDSANHLPDASPIFNNWLGVAKLELAITKRYTVENSIIVPSDANMVSHGTGIISNLNVPNFNTPEIKMNGTSTDPIFISKDFDTDFIDGVVFENFNIVGTLDDYTNTEVDALTGTECIGFLLSAGKSKIHIGVIDVAGVGFIITDNDDSSRYVHGNSLKIITYKTGQEGALFIGPLDQDIEFMVCSWAWNSFRDSDFNKVKTSKYLAGSTENHCSSCIFYRGSADVVGMHNHNNHFGYAISTMGQASASYRLRITRAIGESSAGGILIGPRDDVSGGTLIAHSAIGVNGLPLVDVRTNNNFTFGNVAVEVNRTSASKYPTNGTYRGVSFTGRGAVVGTCRVYGFDPLATIDEYAFVIEGEQHNINGSIDVTDKAFRVDGSFTGSVKLTIRRAIEGISIASSGLDTGSLDINLTGVTNVFQGNSRRYMNRDSINASNIVDLDNGLSLHPRTKTLTIPSALCDGTDRTITTPNTLGSFTYTGGTRQNNLSAVSASIKDGGSVGGVSVAYNIGDTAAISYNLTSSTDVEIIVKTEAT